MKTRLTLAAAIATSLVCGTAIAQTYSPNPNKAQNSNMRTQSGASTAYVYPGDTYLYLERDYLAPGTVTYVYPGTAYVTPESSTVWVVPSQGVSEPVAGTRNTYVPVGQTHSPNPNKVQNNGVPTQYDTYYIYRIDTIAP
jgi:hypothetical protein